MTESKRKAKLQSWCIKQCDWLLSVQGKTSSFLILWSLHYKLPQHQYLEISITLHSFRQGLHLIPNVAAQKNHLKGLAKKDFDCNHVSVFLPSVFLFEAGSDVITFDRLCVKPKGALYSFGVSAYKDHYVNVMLTRTTLGTVQWLNHNSQFNELFPKV